MRKDLYFFVKDYIQRKNLIRPGEAVAAGVSGGADSVCLLLILEMLSREWGFYLCAVHVHHGLRESADADRTYVEELCGRLGVPLHCFHEDAAAAADKWGTGIEEAGRRIRHEAFDRVCASVEEELGATCLAAVAHHMEDQAETVLFHLCRGTDLRGLCGMEPRSGRFIRPLLEVTRGAIEAY
ncbi:MAG: tRNA lysidine(34) synthetase TilS, partial [Lachnospiraceae bacterium]|nr:tRNA lysidine(34) synthetase TilS [Lachnospiraceae bacterium]